MCVANVLGDKVYACLHRLPGHGRVTLHWSRQGKITLRKDATIEVSSRERTYMMPLAPLP